MIKKRYFFIVILSLSALIGYAQQEPIFTQYYLNDIAYNPAIAGSKTYNHLVIQTRQQWLGFEGAPLSSHISYHGAVNNRSALGSSLMYDKTDPSFQGNLQFNYSYHIPLDYEKVNLSLGIGAKLLHYSLDFDLEDLPPGQDPAFSSKAYKKTTGDASSGVYLYGRNFYIGYSVINLLESSFNDDAGKGFNTNEEVKYYYGIAGYRFHVVNKDWELEPSILLRKRKNNDDIYDISGRIFYLNDTWAGVTYRTNGTLALAIGFRSNNMHFSYSYDHTFAGEIMQYTKGTHELTISFKIPSILSARHISFWAY